MSTTSPVISKEEISQVDRFRQLRKTSVLTVLFTDIEGFTHFTEERGDEASDKLRHEHDRIVVSTLEEGGAGQVIKRIGDAVMAVFAEPSAALERALLVQSRLAAWNAEHPEEPLRVRIGLHMGQVTVEDEIQPDVFGRHVNRASRIEGLAAGEQIYLTYPVFDSAKSWLLARKDTVAWALHGRFRVKGIEEAVDVYEAYDPKHRKPRAPEGAARVSAFPKPAAAAVLILAGALAAFGVQRYRRTTVTFEDMGQIDLILDHQDRLVLEGEPGEHLRRVKTPIKPGKHLIHYDVSNVTRYYAPIEVRRGENVLRPQFEYYGMPGMEKNISFDPKSPAEQSFADSFTYATFGADGTKREHKADVTLRLRPEPAGKGMARWHVAWRLDLDGKTVADKTETYFNPSPDNSSQTVESPGWSDDRHAWRLRAYVFPISIQASVESLYSD